MSERINIRTDKDTKNLITRACKAKGMTMSTFIVQAAREVAINTILDQRLYLLDNVDFDKFLEKLEEER